MNARLSSLLVPSILLLDFAALSGMAKAVPFQIRLGAIFSRSLPDPFGEAAQALRPWPLFL
jgi:hypothetical protein